MNQDTKKTCCLCGKELDGPGYNPWPFGSDDNVNATCCEECYRRDVVPAMKTMSHMYKVY